MPPLSRDSYDHTHAAADSLGMSWSLIHRFPSFVTRVQRTKYSVHIYSCTRVFPARAPLAGDPAAPYCDACGACSRTTPYFDSVR
eukprot:COSAG01_NODE_792_length_13554_cov_13.811891_12_plen_85_part_00